MHQECVLLNGSIVTFDAAQPRVTALAIRDGRVVALGNAAEARAALGPRAAVLDLGGRTAIPALTDAHVHLVSHALARTRVQLDDVRDFDEVLRRIAAYAAALPAGAWLRGGGWDHTLWGGRWPTAAELDAVTGGRPALLSRKDGHSAWVNHRALALAGIDATTADPPGGAIQRDADGTPSGIVFEMAIDLVRCHVPAPGEAEILAAVEDAIAEAHGYGMVGMHVPTSMTPGDGALTLGTVQRLRERGRLALRCLMYLGLDGLEPALTTGLRSGFGDRWIRLGGLKFFADGTLGSQTAEMLEPYEGGGGRGLPVIGRDQMDDVVARAIAGGLAVSVHAIGDAANRAVLDAIERGTAAAGGRRPALPHRIEHCQLLTTTDIPRFAQLGVVASMQPIHCTQDLPVAQELWGARCAGAYAWRSLRDSGAVLAFGSDAPVESLDPWLSVHAAVTRERRDSGPAGGWYPEQRLSVAEALEGFTAGAAIAAGAAHEQGRLSPGFLADIAVLDADPFAVEPAHLAGIRADITILEGQVVWQRS